MGWSIETLTYCPDLILASLGFCIWRNCPYITNANCTKNMTLATENLYSSRWYSTMFGSPLYWQVVHTLSSDEKLISHYSREREQYQDYKIPFYKIFIKTSIGCEANSGKGLPSQQFCRFMADARCWFFVSDPFQHLRFRHGDGVVSGKKKVTC